jgi:hypothetical protein
VGAARSPSGAFMRVDVRRGLPGRRFSWEAPLSYPVRAFSQRAHRLSRPTGFGCRLVTGSLRTTVGRIAVAPFTHE